MIARRLETVLVGQVGEVDVLSLGRGVGERAVDLLGLQIFHSRILQDALLAHHDAVTGLVGGVETAVEVDLRVLADDGDGLFGGSRPSDGHYKGENGETGLDNAFSFGKFFYCV